MKRWCCKDCGYVHSGTNPPMKCPKCGASQDKFEYRILKKDDYLQIRQTKQERVTSSDLIILGSGVSAFIAAIVVNHYGDSVIMLEPSDAIGGEDITGFSEQEKNAAFESLKQYRSASVLANETEYAKTASHMLDFFAEKSLLPDFKETGHDPRGDAHPWQGFSGSTVLEERAEVSPETKRTLHHSLAHWATDNDIRVLLNHQVLGFGVDEDSNVVGIRAMFRDKETIYRAEKGILSFLKDCSLSKESSAQVPENYFVTVENIEKVGLNKQETDFWGENAIIGPAMIRAYEVSLGMIDDEQMMSL